MSAAPTQYTRQNNFVADATNNPSISVAGIATDLDAEYEAIRTSVNQTISRLNEIQRSDGLLRSSVLDPAEYAAITAAVSGATNAASSATSASSSAASASTSATTATNRAAEATTAASNVAGYVTTATQRATAAAASATAAATSETNATNRASAAATSATAAATSATSASNSAGTASTKATEAAASAAGAASSASTASTKATEAAASAASVAGQATTATNAATSATSSAATATTGANNASDSATSAQNSATIATNKAAEAALSVVDANSAKTSAISASNSANSAVTAMNLVFNTFDDRFLGTRTSDPTTNNGQALLAGAVYYNSTISKVKFYNGATWDIADAASQNYANAAAASATTAAGHAATAATHVTSAAAQAALAAGSAAASELAYDRFDDRYLGSKTSSPTLDNDGGELLVGAMYWHSLLGQMYVWSGSTWVPISSTASSVGEPVIVAGTSTQYWRGDKTWQTLDKSSVGLGNVDNTSDANKPVSAAVSSALNAKASTSDLALKANLASPSFTGTVSGITKSMVGLSNVDNTSDAAKPVSTATQTALDTKQATIAAGTTAQYYRGDKVWRDFFSDVRSATLTGISTATNAVISSADTVLSALGKLQKQFSDHVIASNPHSTSAAQIGALAVSGGVLNGNLLYKTISGTKATPSISASVLPIDLSAANFFTSSLSAPATLQISNTPASPQVVSFTLQISFASGAVYDITWPASFKWAGGTRPSLTCSTGKFDTFTFMTHDGGATWFAFIVEQNQ